MPHSPFFCCDPPVWAVMRRNTPIFVREPTASGLSYGTKAIYTPFPCKCEVIAIFNGQNYQWTAQPGMWKRITILFNLRAKLMLGFIAVGFITLLLVLLTIGQMAAIVETESRVVSYWQPTEKFSYVLASGVNASMALTYNTQDIEVGQKMLAWEEIWREQINPAADSLERLSHFWTNPAAYEVFAKLQGTLTEIRILQNDFLLLRGQAQSKNALLDLKLKSAHVRAATQTEALAQYQRESIVADSNEVRARMATFKTTEVVLLIVATLIGLLIAYWVSKNIFRQLRVLRDYFEQLAKGNLPGAAPASTGELQPLAEAAERINANLKAINAMAEDISKGNYRLNDDHFDDSSDTGRALHGMADQLFVTATENERRNWTSQGLARFAEILRSNQSDVNQLCTKLIGALAKHLDCQIGGIFLLNDQNPDAPFLSLVASHAYGRDKFIRKQLQIGEGVVGQAYREQEYVHLRELPADYSAITTGFGQAKPNSVLVMPMKVNNQVYGVIELATTGLFEEHHIGFVERLAESTAAAIGTAKINENTKRLLSETQGQAEMLRAQEEEMRQNMEELQATQEEMRRSQKLLVLSEAHSKSFVEGATIAIVSFDHDGKIDGFNPMAEQLFGYERDEVLGIPFEQLLSRDYRDLVDKRTRTKAITKDNESKHVELLIKHTFVLDDDFYTAYLRDITMEISQDRELKRLFKESERIKTKMQESLDSITSTYDNQIKTLKSELENADKALTFAGEGPAPADSAALAGLTRELETAKENLDRTEQRLSAGSWHTNLASGETSPSKNLCELFGQPASALAAAGPVFLDLIAGNALPIAENALDTVLTGNAAAFEAGYLVAGRPVAMQIYLEPELAVQDGENRTVGVHGYAQVLPPPKDTLPLVLAKAVAQTRKALERIRESRY